MKTIISISLVMAVTLLFNGLVSDNKPKAFSPSTAEVHLFKERIVKYESKKPSRELLNELNRLKANAAKAEKGIKELEQEQALNEVKIDTVITTPKKNGFFKRIVTSIKRNN